MNINQSQRVFGPGRGRGRSRARQLRVVTVQASLMGPPSRAAPKPKGSSTDYTATTSSRINWKSPQNSVRNSATSRNTSSSRSRSTSEPESRIIIALTEGRGEATGEVGIAAMDMARPLLILCQISDSQSYVNTLTKINILNPSEILIPLTFVESFGSNRLLEKVKEHFGEVKITGVTRTTFNKSNGLEYVKHLCAPSMNSVLLVLQHRYYALAATAALLTYAETSLYTFYAAESVKIEYQESEASTIIDVATADSLELVVSARPAMQKRYSCLLDVLNSCKTKIGSRTLRASILQPPCSVPDIEARLDCVAELLEHTDAILAIETILIKLANVDQLLSLAIVLPDQAQNCSERQLNYLLLLNTVLEQLMPLRDILDNSRHSFFIEMRTTLSDPAFTEIKELVQAVIHTDAHCAKGQFGSFQRCFAIKSGINGLLDLIRKSYSERVDDLREYVKYLGEKHGLVLTLSNNNKKGYHIVLSLNTRQKKTYERMNLPDEFIQVERLSSSYTMKTLELITLSNRVDDIMVEILKMSNIMIYKLLIEIRGHIGIFYKLCEDIAKLDMLLSLAKASSAIHYVRPKFADYLEVTQARHPLLDFLCSEEPVANPMYASKEYNMNIITGPNGSGKSIFIRQVLLIQVMAQVGCYVPAQSATLRVSDRILARLSLGDDLENGVSSFVLEMKEIQYFFNVLTKNTLMIIDEVCRSTGVEEGTALAMAVCEKLMKSPAFVFFTTHFKLLAKLRDLHFNVKTWQMETRTETKNDQTILHFTYNVIPGVTALERYGIFLAKSSWPENMIKYTEEVLEKLSTTRQRQPPCIKQADAAARLKYDLEAEMKMLKAKKEFTRVIMNEKLTEYEMQLQSLGHDVGFLPELGNSYNDNENDGFYPMSRSDETSIVLPLNENGNPDYYNLQGLSYSSEPEPIFKPSSFCVNFQNVEISQNDEVAEYATRVSEEVNRSLYSNISNHNEGSEHFGIINRTNQALPNIFPQYSSSSFDLQSNNFMNESLFSSYSNVFEPEVLLETDSRVEIQIDDSNVFNSNSRFRFNDRADGPTQLPLFDKDVVQFQDTNVFAKPKEVAATNMALQHNDSFVSVTELQFSLPLQRNIERTSTPIHFHSNQIPSTSKINEPRSTSSESIRWRESSFATPTAPKLNTKNGNNTNSSYFDANVSEAIKDLENFSECFSQDWDDMVESPKQNIKNGCNVQKISSPLKTNSKTSTESIVWTEKAKMLNDNLEKANSVDVTTAISDLQSCSDCFSQDWDYGEQVNLSFRPNSLNKASDEEQKLSETLESLEPLGDIHLELFSDCSTVEVERNQNSYVDEANPSPLTPYLNNDILRKQSQESPADPPQKLSHLEKQANNSKPVECSQEDIFCSYESNKNQTQQVIVVTEVTESPPKLSPNNTSNECKTLDGISKQKRKTLGYIRQSNLDKSGVTPESTQDPYPTSDIEIVKPKKRKFMPPFKSNSNKETKKQRTSYKCPRKLTKKEIEQAFYEQDKKMLESENPSQYLQQILNRPSVKQLQQAEHIMTIRKTSSGVVVTPIEQKKIKPRKRFVVPLKGKSESFAPLLCDANSDKFEQFINSDKTGTETSQENSLSQLGRGVRNFKAELLEQQSVKVSKEEVGYYTQNKDCIDSIVNKYLNEPEETKRVGSQKLFQQEVNSSFFSELSASLDDD